MAYQAIYRKWRPQIFEDIIGQSHITNTLKKQIMSDRISHAYLFCGTRGTGKTTAAKVFVKAVNCLNPQNGSPCNECEICRGIQDGSIMDVTEIDAASNNGVDNIRELRDDVNYVATQTKYRVYIIDEVHMLSTGAFNALLKTLEEPPAHVIFILATTEVHKIPETILSRCQRFDFKRITPSDIIVRMKEIAAADGIEITDDAYSVLAQLADGSMRDGLSILERCVSSLGNKIDRASITDILGMVPNDMLFDITNSVISSDSASVMTLIDNISKEGKDLNVFCDSLIKHFRDLLVCKISNKPENLLEYSDNILLKIKTQAENITYEKLSNAVTILTKAKADAKWVKNPRIIYELSLVKLTQPELDSSQEALLDRLASVEKKAENGIVVKNTSDKKEEVKEEKKSKKKAEVPARLFTPIDKSALTSGSPIVAAARNWDKIAGAICREYPFLNFLINRKITIDGDGIILLFDEKEITLKNLAVKYLQQIQKSFSHYSNTDFMIKPVFAKDMEDYIIDVWDIEESNSDTKINADHPSSFDSNDPFDKLKNEYPDIVEFQDDNNRSADGSSSYEQQELSDEEITEEFLDADEIEKQYSDTEETQTNE